MSDNPVKKARGRYEFSPKNQAVDDYQGECYELSEPQDFDAYCALLERHELSERQSHELTLRQIGHFMDSVYKGEAPRQSVMWSLANAFYEVLQGGRWEAAFPLPWTKFPLHLTETEHRNLEIFCEVENAQLRNPGSKVTSLIHAAAGKWSVSYETARDAYYKWRKLLKRNDLNNDVEK